MLIIQQHLKNGSNHPVIARLGPQMFDLLEFSLQLDKQTRKEIGEFCFSSLATRLCNCWDIWEKISNEENREYLNYQQTLIRSQNSNIITIPSIIKLQNKCEKFLYEAKNFLRDVIQIIRLFYPNMPKDIVEASAFYGAKNTKDGKFIKWAKREFGQEDKVIIMLLEEQQWLARVIQMRNAIEHPGGMAGTLYIENFRFLQEGKISIPEWELNSHAEIKGKCSVAITEDMKEICEGLLKFSEELIIFAGIEKMMDQQFFSNFKLGRIPFEKRDPMCPIKYKYVLRC